MVRVCGVRAKVPAMWQHPHKRHKNHTKIRLIFPICSFTKGLNLYYAKVGSPNGLTHRLLGWIVPMRSKSNHSRPPFRRLERAPYAATNAEFDRPFGPAQWPQRLS